MTLGDITIGSPVVVAQVGGERAFRRRMMELGLLPGTRVEIVRVAPLGDPIELRLRGCLLSIRREEARCIAVSPGVTALSHEPSTPAAVVIRPGVPASP